LSDALTNSVSLKGAVIRPGSYGWSEGLRFSEIISNVSRDLEKTADLEYALIIREKNENLEIEVHQFSIINALLNKKSDTDPILQMNDQILVFDNVNIDKFDTEKNDLSLNRIRENISMNGSTKNILSTEEISNSLDYNNLEKSNNSRETLLKPIIDKLKSQAREGSPVRIASISGAVKLPGQYPISEESNAYELVNAAGGFLDSAFIQSVEVRRIVETIDGNVEANYLQYDLTTDKALKGLVLKSRDNLNVRQNSNWNPQDTIKLSGEVRFPGEYLISKGETLRSVIARAGGLTSEAFAEGAIFTREVIANMEAERAKDFALQVRKDYASSILTEETNNTTFEDILSITSQLETFEGQGRLLIDLNAVLQDRENGNITVTDGDALMIPKISKTITVVGEVRRQGSHTFINSLEIDDYLALSAGVTKRADNDGIYIVKANGSVVIPNNSLTTFSQRNASLQIGDTIVVPVNTQYKDSVPFWRDVTQIIYQGTVAIAAIARL
ncbi:MAG: SLBB domain-containing protein, partial [Hellea sp.]